MAPSRIGSGASAPLGATVAAGGEKFSVFSRHATGAELLLFDHADDGVPARVVPIGGSNRTGHTCVMCSVAVSNTRPDASRRR